MEYKYLKIEDRDGTFILTINKERSMNALNEELLRELNHLFTELRLNEDVEVLIITGTGKAFIAGADISEMVNLTPPEARAFARKGMETFSILEKLNKPVIAAINGFALGGGCELALACDIRIATKNAKIGQPEVSLGITPGFGGTQRLAREIGISKAKELIYTGEFLSGQEAFDIGLVSYIVEPEELIDKALKIADKIKKNAKYAVRYAKESINTGLQADIDTAMNIEKSNFALCFATEDQKEGMRAFLEKRKSNFEGK